MSDWGQGYHVGIAYTLGFYPELAPTHLEAALLFAGFKSNLTRAGARYCELGSELINFSALTIRS